jgi:hypothetical protein
VIEDNFVDGFEGVIFLFSLLLERRFCYDWKIDDVCLRCKYGAFVSSRLQPSKIFLPQMWQAGD